MATITRRTVYFTVAKRFDGVDIRCGQAHATRKSAQGWVPFVRASWRGLARVRVLACKLRWVDGKLDEASIARLDKAIDPATVLLFRLTVRKLREWAVASGRKDGSPPVLTAPGERVEFHRRSGWHYDSDVQSYNRKDADGVLMTDGDVRWFYDYRGYLRSGTAYHNINSMWWVVSGAERLNLSAHELFAPRPGMPRRKRDPERQRRRLEGEKKKAVDGENYERAALLRDLLRRAA